MYFKCIIRNTSCWKSGATTLSDYRGLIKRYINAFVGTQSIESIFTAYVLHSDDAVT